MLFLPSQVLNIEQATSRVQYLIDLYKKDNERLPSWTLPESERAQTDAALAILIRYVLVLEAFLVRICMFFPDEMVRTVIAIVVCTHHQQDLIASQPFSQSARYVVTRDNAQSMTQYLDALTARLLAILQWITSEDGKLHRRIVNDAILNMQYSLDGFTRTPLSSRPYEPALAGASPWDVVDLSATQDLQVLMHNFVPLSVACRRAEACTPPMAIWRDPTAAPPSTPTPTRSAPAGPPPLARLPTEPTLALPRRRRERQTGAPPIVPRSPMRLPSKRQRRADLSSRAKRARRASDDESSSEGERGSPATSTGSTAVASDSVSESESDSDDRKHRRRSARVVSDAEGTTGAADDRSAMETEHPAEDPAHGVPKRSWLDMLIHLFVRRR